MAVYLHLKVKRRSGYITGVAFNVRFQSIPFIVYALPPVYFFIGTTKHEETSWKSILKFFQIQVDFDEKNSEAGKCERNSSDNKNKKKTLLACSFSKAEITKESNSEKSKEKNSDTTAGLLGTTNDPKKSKNGTGEDGMDSVIEKHGEAKHGVCPSRDVSLRKNRRFNRKKSLTNSQNII